MHFSQSPLLSAPIGLTEHKASPLFQLRPTLGFTPLLALHYYPLHCLAGAHFALQPVVNPFMLSLILWEDDRGKNQEQMKIFV